MKKVGLIILTLVVLIVGVSGFMFINNSKAEKLPAKQTKQEVSTKNESITEPETITEQKAPEKAYNIEKIVVAIEGDLLPRFPEFQPLNNFSMTLLNEIAKDNNITIETKVLPTFEDVRASLTNKESDIQFLTYAENQSDLTMSYSYVNTAVYNGNKITQPERDWVFVLHQDNTELNNLLNDSIAKYQENGKLDELKKQYLGQ
jgi:ABC-type amino acid transport substrate-binding protein